MKHISSILLVTSVVIAAACKDYSETNHMEQMSQMKDSIFKAYPTTASVHMDVADRTELIIVLGDRHLYKADDARRHKVAVELGHMSLRLFGHSTDIDKEKFVVTADERNQVDTPKDGLITYISVDSLKKASK